MAKNSKTRWFVQYSYQGAKNAHFETEQITLDELFKIISDIESKFDIYWIKINKLGLHAN